MATYQSTIINATLIAAPSSAKNEKKERDPEMHQPCNSKQWYQRFAEGFASGVKIQIAC